MAEQPLIPLLLILLHFSCSGNDAIVAELLI